MEALLSAEPASAARARRLVIEALHRGGCEYLSDVAELLVSELVTNAILHAGSDVRLYVHTDGRRVRVEVADASAALPQVRHFAIDATTGRGLELVEALAPRWGATPTAGGKTVWFELDREAS